eukprot:SAG22_NODE_34_length_27479_cov_10.947480_13_plen_90_part_00
MPALLERGAPLNSRLAPAAQLESTHVFASHGAADSVTPAAIGRENVLNFGVFTAGAGGVPRLEWHEYARDDHQISAECLADVAGFFSKV